MSSSVPVERPQWGREAQQAGIYSIDELRRAPQPDYLTFAEGWPPTSPHFRVWPRHAVCGLMFLSGRNRL